MPPAYNRCDDDWGESDDDVIEGAREHMRRAHPELVDKVTRDDLLGWIEEV